MNKTKTNYITYLNCKRQGWYEYNNYSAEELSFSQKAIISESYKVEKLSTELFPNIKESNDFIKEISQPGPLVLYQPKIIGEDNFHIRADIIEKDSDSNINLYEIKNSTKEKKNYIPDIAIQKAALKFNGITLEKANLILIDNQYALEGAIDAWKLFKIIDVTDEVNEYLEIELNIPEYVEEIESDKILDRSISSKNCNSCPFLKICFKGIPNSIRKIPRGNIGNKIAKLIDRGITDLNKIPEDIKLTDNQQKYVDIQISNHPQIRIQDINESLNSLKFPIAYYDIETINEAIPIYEGVHPFEQIPFQFSLHLLDKEGNLDHKDYLHLDKSNPMPEFLKTLAAVVPNEGSVIVWNDSFEKRINNMMAEKYPEYKILLNDLNERMFDLSIIFKNSYLHPKFMGSYSLKNVLPIFYDKLQYSDLAISEGLTASFKWADMIFGNLDMHEKEKIKEDLLAYSKLDTESMFHIYQSLVNLVN